MSGALGDVISVGSLGLIDGDDLTGKNAEKAAKQASKTQAQALDKSIDFQRESRDLAIDRIDPAVEFGFSQINPLTQLLTSQGQANYLQNNPLFDAALDSINKATLNNQAARGKLGSGGTLNALQNNYLSTALPFLNNQQNALFNAVNLGTNAASGQANTINSTGANISNLLGQQGDVRAAGIVGAQGAGQAAFNNLLNLGGQLGSAYLGGIG